MPSHDSKLVVLRPRRSQGDVVPSGPLTVDATLVLHLDGLFATARLLTGEVAAAEDLVQETALAAFRSWGELRNPSAVKTWLLRILHNTHVSARRHSSRRPPFVDLNIEELLTHPLLQAEPDLPDNSLSGEVALALESLPLEYREAVWLIDVEEQTIAEAAQVLDVPVGTAASRVHRARRLLRERLSEQIERRK